MTEQPAPPAPEPGTGAERPAGGPIPARFSDDDIAGLLTQLAQPFVQFINELGGAMKQVLRRVLDAEYLRGYVDGAESAMPGGVQIVFNDSGSDEPVLTADQVKDVLGRHDNGGTT